MNFQLFTAPLVCLALVTTPAWADAQADVDGQVARLSDSIANAGLREIVEIDHARLAAAEDVAMPPSRVVIFSDGAANAPLLQANVRTGLDLPMRVLSFQDGEAATAMFTGIDFLVRRHGLDDTASFPEFPATMKGVLNGADLATATRAPVEGLAPDFGILELASIHDFATTIARLKEVVTAQDDTVWFGEVDFQQEADENGATIGPATLLLFGGPAPGGVAMAEFPAIGLDAFCQKLLVYQDDSGAVHVIYNDIAALAELYYGRTAKPHHALNERLTQTFSSAVLE